MLALVVVVLTAADVLCAVPCESLAASAEARATTAVAHCQRASADADAVTVAAADPCGPEHARLSPAEAASRRATVRTALAAVLPRSMRAQPKPRHARTAAARNAPDDGAAAIVPPLRI